MIARMNRGKRVQYSPAFLRSRFEYVPSDGPLNSLTEEQRKIILPVPYRFTPGRTFTAQ